MKRRSLAGGLHAEKGTFDVRVTASMPLVPVIVEHVCRQLAQPLDRGILSKDGIAGLVDAARSYIPQSRVPFRVYVKHRIKASILDGLGAETQGIRLEDEFILSLFGLQRSLEYHAGTAKPGKQPAPSAKSHSAVRNISRKRR